MSARRRKVLLREGKDGALCGGLYLQGESVNDLVRGEKRKWDRLKQAHRDRTAAGRWLDGLHDSSEDIGY